MFWRWGCAGWIVLVALASSTASSPAGGQETTPFTQAAAIEGEDPAILKMLFDVWDRREKKYTLQGQVLTVDQKPAANAKWRAIVDMGVWIEGKADVEGRFTIRNSNPFVRSLQIESADGAAATVVRYARIPEAGPHAIKAVLRPWIEVKYTVRDAQGAVVPGAYAGVYIDSSLAARGQADKEGVVRMRLAELSSSYEIDEISMFKAVYAFARDKGLGYGVFRDSDGEREIPAEVVLTAPQTIQLRVRGRDGKGLAGLPVAVHSAAIAAMRSRSPRAAGGAGVGAMSVSYFTVPLFDDPRGFEKSNEEGSAKISWFAQPVPPELRTMGFPNRSPAPVALSVIHPVWGSELLQVDPNAPSVEIACTFYEPIKIAGRVLLPSGEGAAGIRLKSEGATVGTAISTDLEVVTDADGKFALTSGVHQPNLQVTDAKWVADPISLSKLVREPKTNELVEVRLREGRRVTFRVTQGPEYKGKPDYSFDLLGKAGVLHLKTNERGIAEATLDRGVYEIVSSSAPLSARNLASEPETLLVKDEIEITVPLHLPPEQLDRKVKVTVLANDGATPVENASVELLNPATNLALRSSPAAEAARMRALAGRGAMPGRPEGIGGFPPSAFGTAPGRATKVVVTTDVGGKALIEAPLALEGWFLVTAKDGSKGLAVIDVLADECKVTLRPEVTIRGRILDEKTGMAAAGMRLVLQLDLQKLTSDGRGAPRNAALNRALTSTQIRGETDAEGMFEISGLLADAPYQLTVSGGGSGPLEGAMPPESARVANSAMFRSSMVSEFQATQKGMQDLGELRVSTAGSVFPRAPAPPNDPNGGPRR